MTKETSEPIPGAPDIELGVRQRSRAAKAAGALDIEQLLRALPAAVYTTDAEGRLTFYNGAASALWGREPELDVDRWCGSLRLLWPDGTPLPHADSPMAIALRNDTALNGVETLVERPDGIRVACLSFPAPLHDGEGRIVGAVNMLVDTTDRKRVEQRLASIVESSDDAIVSKDLNGTIMTWNRGAEKLFGYSEQDAIGRPIAMLIPEDHQNEEPQILERIRSGDRVHHYETIRQRRDGSLVEISLAVSPVKDGGGRIVGASKIARDITERRLSEARINALAAEVDHRAKNLLALVLATVRLTKSDSATELKRSIEGRIQALANANLLLSDSRWTGADLRRLVAEELAPFAHDGDRRLSISGPPLTLAANMAQSMAVTLHELTTNAVKYGALSVHDGHIGVSWTIDAAGEVTFLWSETGGPTVEPPTRRGFGTNVIERMICGDLKGQIRMHWRREGLLCEIVTLTSHLS